MSVGEEVSYKEVSAIIGEDAQSAKGTSITQRARARVLREDQIVITCVPTEGFRRVSEPEKTDVAKGHLRKVRSTVKRGFRIIISTDVTKLRGKEQKVQHSVTLS